MPHKFNADRRDKIPRQKYRVTNWAEYNESLRCRGDLTVWISDDALALWAAPRRTTRGGQPRYSDLAIELCLTLGVVFKQPLRQTQGLMRSVTELLGVEIAVPDFSTLSRRGNGLILQTRPRADSQAAIHLAVDSTGLKIFGEGEWLEEKHKNKAKGKSWRKLHLGLDLVSGEIVCSDLTTMTSAIRQRFQTYWIKSTAQLICFWRTALMMEAQHATFLPSVLDRLSRSRSRLPKRDFQHESSRNALFAIAILPTSQPTGGWPGRRPPATISAAVRDTNGPLEGCHRPQAKGARLRKPENRSQDWRPHTQPDDRTWPPHFERTA